MKSLWFSPSLVLSVLAALVGAQSDSGNGTNQLPAGRPVGKLSTPAAQQLHTSRSLSAATNAASQGPAPPFFLPAVTYSSGGLSPSSVAVADLNGDGYPDVVVANQYQDGLQSGAVGVLLGNGDGTFQPPTTYSSGGQIATSVAIADLNGDHIPDLVVSNCGAIGADGCQTGDGVVGVLLGKGDGTFLPVVTYDTGWSGAYSVAVADVNGDLKPDLVVANIGGSTGSEGIVGVLVGNGDGTFQTAVTYPSGGQGPLSLTMIDVNDDRKTDIIVLNDCANPEGCTKSSVGVLLNNGDGTFQPAVLYDTVGDYSQAVAVADVNHDEKPDIIIANGDTSGTDEGSIAVLVGNGDGTFQPATIYASGGRGAWSVAVADVSGDGKPDVLTTNYFDTTVGLLLGNGDGTLQPVAIYNADGASPSAVAVADLNGDHTPDLIVAECQLAGCESAGNDLVGVLLHVGTTKTKTAVASSLNPSVFGQLVTLTATVTSGSGKPTGTVIFFDGSTPLSAVALSNGSASVSLSNLAAASHSVVAVYQGSMKYNSSGSSSLNQVVKMATTTTSLTPSHNPSPVQHAVTYRAVVTSQYGGEATGTVTFSDGGSPIGTVPVEGNEASFRQKYSVPGEHSITATYSGDASNTGSSSASLTEAIKDPSTTSLRTSGSPSLVGQPVTFTATVTSPFGSVPDGELVTFVVSKTTLGTGKTANGIASLTTSFPTAETRTIRATYSGDTTFESSSGIVQQVVARYSSSVTLKSSPNPSNAGQAVSLVASVSSAAPGGPTGTVTFKNGSTTLGSPKLASGQASLTTTKLPTGTLTITASYNGDAQSAKSSGTVQQIVNP